jgi:hypothetical protein
MPLANDDRDGLRRCRDCGEWKLIEEFHKSPRRPGGRGSYCQPCFNERSKVSYRKRMKEKHGKEVREPREVPDGHRYCPMCQVTKLLEEFPRNRSASKGRGAYCKPCHNARSQETADRLYGGTREYHLQRRYGIGEAEFQELLAAQGGVCAICRTPDPNHVDHDHRTGYIRGILCFNCNGALGHVKDDPGILIQALAYLEATTSLAIQRSPGGYWRQPARQGRHPTRPPRGDDRRRTRRTRRPAKRLA